MLFESYSNRLRFKSPVMNNFLSAILKRWSLSVCLKFLILPAGGLYTVVNTMFFENLFINSIIPNGNGFTNPGTPIGNNPSGSALGPFPQGSNQIYNSLITSSFLRVSSSSCLFLRQFLSDSCSLMHFFVKFYFNLSYLYVYASFLFS